MKRLILRISALVTVVTLGLIAIAQAQRGAEGPALSADSQLTAAPHDEGEPRPITAADDARFMPSPPDRSLQSNPLRPASNITATTRSSYSITSDESAAVAQEPPAASVQTAEPTGTGTAAASDPFAGRYRSVGGAAETSSIPPASEVISSMPPAASSYPALAGPEETGAPTETIAAAPRELPASSIPNRYTATGPANVVPPAEPAASTPGEPAPFQLDPRAATSTMPDTGSPAAGSYQPGSITAPRDLAPPTSPSMPSGGSSLGSSNSLGAAPRADASAEGTGRPGTKLQEGPQTPQLTIHKTGPAEIQVGKPAKFQVRVINTGQVAAASVEVRDLVPKGTQLITTTPQAQRGVRGELVWDLGTMQPGQEETVEMELMPTAEGEIGSVATVRMAAEASARAVATKPELEIQVACPNRVTIGEDMKLEITISNPGSGVASNVILEEHVPAGLQHPAGTELEYEVGTLQPNESRKLELTLSAARPGPFTNLLVARGDASLRTESQQEVTIVAPQLDVALDGPSRRYLEREATYTVSISNPGTAPARDVELIAELPVGMKFVSADNQGHYDEATRTVLWRLAELPVNTTGSVVLTAMPMEPGTKTLRVAGSADRVNPVQQTQPIQVEGIAAILFQVVDVDDPIEKGGETAYEIRVLNQGSKASTNVQLEATVPPEMKVLAAEGPVRHLIEGNRVRFESLARLAPKADTTYRIRVQGLQPGDLRVRVQLMSDEMDRPVVKEESTRVYSDE